MCLKVKQKFLTRKQILNTGISSESPVYNPLDEYDESLRNEISKTLYEIYVAPRVKVKHALLSKYFKVHLALWV